jgi:L-threonylcarbamoyladenylate synthase
MITKEQLELVLGHPIQSAYSKTEQQIALCPGIKYQHYAPKAPIWLVLCQDHPKSLKAWQKLIIQEQQQGRKVGLLVTQPKQKLLRADVVLSYCPKNTLKGAASLLYAQLRQFDLQQVDVIYAEVLLGETGLHLALQDRLHKAAGGKILKL